MLADQPFCTVRTVWPWLLACVLACGGYYKAWSLVSEPPHRPLICPWSAWDGLTSAGSECASHLTSRRLPLRQTGRSWELRALSALLHFTWHTTHIYTQVKEQVVFLKSVYLWGTCTLYNYSLFCTLDNPEGHVTRLLTSSININLIRAIDEENEPTIGFCQDIFQLLLPIVISDSGYSSSVYSKV